MRADARRNRRRLLDAATALILESGREPTRDAIAQRAGLGIGTLYRHFPDRQSLLRGVALDVLDRAIAAGEHALSEAADGTAALGEYLHAAVDIGLGALNLIHPLIDEPDWPDRSARAGPMLDQLVDRARDEGTVSREFTATDLALAVIRFCRPLAIGLSPVEEREIARRHIDTYLAGLAATAQS